MQKWNTKNYLLFMLVVVAAFSYFDRFIFALALELIKKDLDLSDSQLGFMTGIAFAAFYAFAGIPIARWADKGDRITISSLAVGLLGATVSLCGAAINFVQLLIARAGVAVGEAGSIPAAQSLLTDYFDRLERPRAMAIYFMAYPISMIIGYLLGGWLIDIHGWRITFVLVGVPAVLVALWVKFSLRDPRFLNVNTTIPTVKHESLIKTFFVLWEKTTFRSILFCFLHLLFLLHD